MAIHISSIKRPSSGCHASKLLHVKTQQTAPEKMLGTGRSDPRLFFLLWGNPVTCSGRRILQWKTSPRFVFFHSFCWRCHHLLKPKEHPPQKCVGDLFGLGSIGQGPTPPKKENGIQVSSPFFLVTLLNFVRKETPLFFGGDRIFGGFQAEHAVPDDHLHPLRACHLFTHRLRLRLVAAPRCFDGGSKGHQDLSSSLIIFLQWVFGKVRICFWILHTADTDEHEWPRLGHGSRKFISQIPTDLGCSSKFWQRTTHIPSKFWKRRSACCLKR